MVALDVRAADEARPQRAEQPHVLLDCDDAEAAIGERERDDAAAGSRLDDERASPQRQRAGDARRESSVAQEML